VIVSGSSAGAGASQRYVAEVIAKRKIIDRVEQNPARALSSAGGRAHVAPYHRPAKGKQLVWCPGGALAEVSEAPAGAVAAVAR